MTQPKMSCEHQVVPKLKLIFSKSHGSGNGEKERLKSFWEFAKTFRACKSEEYIAPVPNLEIKAVDESVITDEVLLTDTEKYQALFELMVSKGLDKHALAISPNDYRKKPQVCNCFEVCCFCFDYSHFLHNLKLHDFKKGMIREYKRNHSLEIDERISETRNSEMTEVESVGKPLKVFDEFYRKGVKINGGDSSSFADGTLTEKSSVIKRSKKTPPADALKSSRSKSKPIYKKRDVPAYESSINSVHKRLRKFDPNLYKKLVVQQVEQSINE